MTITAEPSWYEDEALAFRRRVLRKTSGLSPRELADYALQLDRARWSPPEQKRVAAILRRLGYKSKKVGTKYARVNGWVKVDPTPTTEPEGDDVPF